MANFFNKVIKTSIYLLVFLLPLFWLPFSFELFEFNKQYLLFFSVSIALFAWLAKMILVEKELRFKKTPLDLLVVVFILIAILSAIFSVDKISSLFGFYGRFNNGLIGLISLAVLYFLITNNTGIGPEKLKTKMEKAENYGNPTSIVSAQGLLKAFLWSSFFVILVSYLSIFGIWQKIGQIGQIGQIGLIGLIGQPGFNLVAGSPQAFSIFLVVLIVLLVGRILLGVKGKLSLLINYLLLLASLGLLIIIDFPASWLILSITLFLFLALAIGRRLFRENVNRLLLPIFLMILAIAFLFLNLNLFNLPKELILTQQESWLVGFKGATENIKSGFLGSGIGTWYYDFAKFKSLWFNQASLWQIRFDRSGSHLSEILGTMGFLGLIAYFALIGFFLLISWFILGATKKGELFPGLPLLPAFLALIIGQFFYYQNTILAFTFWLILGLSVVSWQKPISEKTLSFKDFPEISLIASTFLIILGLLILGGYFFAVKFYLADHYYLKAVREVSIQNLEKATKFNPLQSHYKIVLARAYLNEILNEMAKPAPDQQVLSEKIQLAISYAKKASDVSPNLVSTWETLGMIYREIRGIATGAVEWGIKSFETAIKLEPTNPFLHTELGKLYFNSGDKERAKAEFSKALELKSDYLDASIQMALMEEREGKLSEAIKKMEDLANAYPYNVEVLFQLGRLYFNNNQLDEAISQFERAVGLMPNYANALYSLGLAYQKKGEKEKAIKSFEKVLELNPGNQDVIQKLKELK